MGEFGILSLSSKELDFRVLVLFARVGDDFDATMTRSGWTVAAGSEIEKNFIAMVQYFGRWTRNSAGTSMVVRPKI